MIDIYVFGTTQNYAGTFFKILKSLEKIDWFHSIYKDFYINPSLIDVSHRAHNSNFCLFVCFSQEKLELN